MEHTLGNVEDRSPSASDIAYPKSIRTDNANIRMDSNEFHVESGVKPDL